MDVNVTAGLDQNTLDALKTLASKLGTTAEMLWVSALKQVYIDAYKTCAIVGLFGLVSLCLWLFSMYARYKFKHRDTEWNAKEVWDNVHILATILAAITSLVFIVGCFEAVSDLFQLMNPEYAAMKKIASMLK